MKKKVFVNIAGQPYEIIASDAQTYPVLDKAYGVCNSNNHTILILEDLPEAKFAHTLTHEVLHALIAESGGAYATAAAMGVGEDDPKVNAWEEMFVRVMTPHVLAAFGAPMLNHGKRRRQD